MGRGGGAPTRRQSPLAGLSSPAPLRPPRGVAAEGYRQFRCERCQCEVRICTSCDRGNRYCGTGCSREARRECLDRARRRFNATKKGIRGNRRRQRRFRARPVTDQGSHMSRTVREERPNRRDETCATGPAGMEIDHGPRSRAQQSRKPLHFGFSRGSAATSLVDPAPRCDLCGRSVAPLPRTGFLPPVERKYQRGARPRNPLLCRVALSIDRRFRGEGRR